MGGILEGGGDSGGGLLGGGDAGGGPANGQRRPDDHHLRTLSGLVEQQQSDAECINSIDKSPL